MKALILIVSIALLSACGSKSEHSSVDSTHVDSVHVDSVKH